LAACNLCGDIFVRRFLVNAKVSGKANRATKPTVDFRERPQDAMHHMAQEQAPCIAGGAPAPSASHGALRRGGHSDWFFTSEATVAFIQVVAIDLVLAGDNAVVIGLAAAGLPPQQRMRAGNALLLQSDVLRAVAGKVATFAPETNESLREALFAASNGEAEIGSKGISLPLIGRTGERHAVHVLPLTSGARCKANTRAAAAAVFVRKSTLEYPSAPELIGNRYKMTAAIMACSGEPYNLCN
jgi:hypothetical protein